jgi:hypothetical protein
MRANLADMPRFVILRHELPSTARAGVHWDLMLEQDGVLRTWALAAAPGLGEAIAADALPDHRLDYLTYEGPISGDRGEVSRWDEGTYEVRSESLGELHFRLSGSHLAAECSLTKSLEADQRWTFVASSSI